MNRIKLTPIIKQILEDTPAARESDTCLLYHFYKRIGVDVTRPWYQINNSGLPNEETVGRVRRKIAEQFPELRGTLTVQERRAQEETAWREWVKDVVC